jgi:hypothetical protein
MRRSVAHTFAHCGFASTETTQGMANYNKNLFVGTGGVEAINLSHFIGALSESSVR